MKKHYLLALVAAIALAGCENDNYINDEGNLVPRTVVDDASLPSITVNGTQLHAEAFGNPNDPMVVFLHGGPGSDYRNAFALKDLAEEGYYVVFFDQRGAGLSERHPYGSYTMQQAFDDLTGVIAHYKTSPSQKVFLFGHSWGAILAAGYINKYPTEIDGSIFAEAGGFTWNEVLEYAKRTQAIHYLAEDSNDAVYLDQFITGRENDQAILDYKLAMRSSFNYAKGSPEGTEGPFPFWRLGSVAYTNMLDVGKRDNFDMTQNLGNYEPKVLFLYGELNKALGEYYCKQEAEHFNNYQMTEIKGTGHELIYFKWDSVHPVVTEYLNSLNGSSK